MHNMFYSTVVSLETNSNQCFNMNVTGITENTSTVTPAASANEKEVNLFFAVFHPLLIIITVLGNLATIIAFWKEQRLRGKPSDLLILALAVVDLITGLVVIPLQSSLYIIPGQRPIGEFGCLLLVFTANFVLISSLLILIGISLDRFFLISQEYPHYLKQQSGYRVHIYIAFALGVAALTDIIELSLWNYMKRVNDYVIDYNSVCLSPPRRNVTFSLTFFFICFITPVVIVTTLSTGFLYLLWHRLLKTREVGVSNRPGIVGQDTASNNPSGNARSTPGDSGSASDPSVKNRYVKPAITLLALVTAMFICMVPYCSYVIIVNFICPKCSNLKVLWCFATSVLQRMFRSDILCSNTN